MTLYLSGIVKAFTLIFNNNLELHVSTHFSFNAVHTSPGLNHNMTSGSKTLQPRVSGGIGIQIISKDQVLFIKRRKKLQGEKSYIKKITPIVLIKSYRTM